MTNIILNIADCQKMLKENQGIIIFKFTADWCTYCSKIQPHVQKNINKLPKNIQYYVIDVDENIELYSFFKNKKRLNGIPAFFAFYKDNSSYIPNETVIGANIQELDLFFEKCIQQSKLIV